MAFTLAQAKKLCNATELQLVMASMPKQAVTLSPAQLRSKIVRARTLRDKNTDLFRSQTAASRAATRSKRGDTGAANQRTENKVILFDESLKRFEARLAKVEALAAKAQAAKAKLAGKLVSKAPVKKVIAKSPTKAAVVKAPAQPAPPKKSAVKKAAAKTAPAKTAAAKKALAKTAPAKTAAVKSPVQKPVVRKTPAKSVRR